MQTFLNIFTAVVLLALIVLAVLYFYGKKMQTRQVESQKVLEANTQTVTMLVIDKKKMSIKDAPVPKQLYEQTPWYMKRAKIGVVKGKVGPKLFNFICDTPVFRQVPVKAEMKAKVSGLYITEILKGAVLDEKALKKRQKEKEKAAKQAAKEAAKKK